MPRHRRRHDHVGYLSSSSACGRSSATAIASTGRWPFAGHTINVVPSTPVISTVVPAGQRHVGAAVAEPALAGEHHVADAAGTADDVERHDLVADEAAVHALARWPPWRASDRADARPHEQDAGGGDGDGDDDLGGDGIRGDHGHDGRGEAPDGGEQGVEGEVVQLDGQEHDAGDDPGDGHTAPSFHFRCYVARHRTHRRGVGTPSR